MRSTPSEVLDPPIAAWMKKRYHLTRERVDSGQVGSFAQIAPVAGQREILIAAVPTMLHRDDVFDVMSKSAMFLTEMAIFAAVIRAYTHNLPRRRIHF